MSIGQVLMLALQGGKVVDIETARPQGPSLRYLLLKTRFSLYRARSSAIQQAEGAAAAAGLPHGARIDLRTSAGAKKNEEENNGRYVVSIRCHSPIRWEWRCHVCRVKRGT